VAAAIATPSSTVLSDFMGHLLLARLWSIAILLVLQASVTEIAYDMQTVHSILSLWMPI
jgi:hypothetical protein